jgi:YegS/Rv2252/BmrU family lipid kinase
MKKNMKVIIVINQEGGSVKRLNINEEMVRDLFNKVSIETEIHIVDCKYFPEIVKEAIKNKTDAVIAGGGDGTISTVAGLLVGTEIPLGVFPLGTLNHFAKDIGMSADLSETAQQISAGKIISIDIGVVNGRFFINNSSIGLYPEIIQKREQQRKKFGLNKWLAMTLSSIEILTSFPVFKVQLQADKIKINSKTPFVFIGNNQYEMNLFSPGYRKSISKGKLSLYVSNCTNKLSMYKLAIAFIFNHLKQEKNFTASQVNEVWIATKKKIVEVSVDGEVIYMNQPLHYIIRPAALKVIIPKEKEL